MSKDRETQSELPLPSQAAQEAPTGAEMAGLLRTVISAVTALGARVEALTGNQEARKVIEAARSTQSAANRSLENVKDVV